MVYEVPCVPDSLNKYAGRRNIWEYREMKKFWERLVAVYCKPVPEKPIERAVVTLEYFFQSNRRHDPDNYAGKMILDGLVRAGILADDSFWHIELRLKQGGISKSHPRTVIRIEGQQ